MANVEGAVAALVDRLLPEEQRQSFKEQYEFETAASTSSVDLDGKATDIVDEVYNVDDVTELDELQRKEEEGKNRSTVLRAIAGRREDLV